MERASGIASPTRAEQVRGYLLGKWRGRGGTGDPKLWLTEGGARLGQSQATTLALQAELVRLNWERMTAAPGIQMWTNYLLYANPVADSACARIGSRAAYRGLFGARFWPFPRSSDHR